MLKHSYIEFLNKCFLPGLTKYILFCRNVMGFGCTGSDVSLKINLNSLSCKRLPLTQNFFFSIVALSHSICYQIYCKHRYKCFLELHLYCSTGGETRFVDATANVSKR